MGYCSCETAGDQPHPDEDLLAELERQDRAEQRCVCGHLRGWHLEDEGLCLARLPQRTSCPCQVFRAAAP